MVLFERLLDVVGIPERSYLYVNNLMEGTIKIHVEKLPEGVYLATSDDVQGLVAQGRTITETLEIARDVAKKLIEEQKNIPSSIQKLEDNFDYPLLIGI